MKSDMAGQRGREGYFVRMSGWEIKGRWGAHVGLKNQTTFFFFFFLKKIGLGRYNNISTYLQLLP